MRLLALVFLALVTAIAHSVAHAADAPSHRLFVTNYRDDTVSVINGDTRVEESVLQVGATPQGIAHRAEPPLVAVASSRGDFSTLIYPVSLLIVGGMVSGGDP